MWMKTTYAKKTLIFELVLYRDATEFVRIVEMRCAKCWTQQLLPQTPFPFSHTLLPSLIQPAPPFPIPLPSTSGHRWSATRPLPAHLPFNFYLVHAFIVSVMVKWYFSFQNDSAALKQPKRRPGTVRMYSWIVASLSSQRTSRPGGWGRVSTKFLPSPSPSAVPIFSAFMPI